MALAGAVALAGGVAPRASASTPAADTVAPMPMIVVLSPRDGASYQRGKRIVARFRCSEGGVAIVSCVGTVRRGRAIDDATNYTVCMAF